MRILHAITTADLGGAQSVLISICNRAMENGEEVFVLSGEGDMWDLLDSRIVQIKLPNLHRELSPYKDLKVLLELIKINKKIKPDVIHLHSSKMGVLGRLAFPKNKIIYTIHGFDSVRKANPKFIIVEKLLQKRAYCLVGVSSYDKKMLNEEGIYHNVKVIYNGIEDLSYENSSNEISCKELKMKEVSENHKILMTIARLSPQKKFNLFCDIAVLYQNEPSYKFVWIGNKNNEKIDNLPDNVLLLGEVKEASRLLKYADAFLLPSNYEGLPISILEAMSYGKPIVASNVGGIPEILNNENGFVSENNAQSFKYYIDQILKEPDAYNHFSQKARNTFEQYFLLDKMYNEYFALYKEIISKNR